MIWLGALFGLLSLALQWWLARKATGPPLSEREIRQWNHFNALTSKIRGYSASMGCLPEGDGDDAPHELTAGPDGMEWQPGSIITDRLFEMIVRQLGLPAAKNLLTKIQDKIASDPDGCVAFVLQLIKDQQ